MKPFKSSEGDSTKGGHKQQSILRFWVKQALEEEEIKTGSRQAVQKQQQKGFKDYLKYTEPDQVKGRYYATDMLMQKCVVFRENNGLSIYYRVCWVLSSLLTITHSCCFM